MAGRRRLEGQTKARMEAWAKVTKALAHPTRLFIVDELSRGERCVCDLTEKIGASSSGRVSSSMKGAAFRSSIDCASPAS